MSKAILISIKPKWVAKILNGKKTFEIRKRFPKDYVGWVYIYCTKDKKYANLINRGGFLTGMVVARFWCDKVENIQCIWSYAAGNCYEPETFYEHDLLEKSCLTYSELNEYLNGKNGYAIHITKLEIFDKPKEIGEFNTKHYPQFAGLVKNTIHYELQPLTKAPQSWCYIEV